MALLSILTAPHPILSKTSSSVDPVDIDDSLRNYLNDMLNTMYSANGIGLAAPQVGQNKRMIVIDLTPDGTNPIKMINPEIVWASEEDSVLQEGCLSIPNHYDNVIRPRDIVAHYLDETGAQKEIKATDLMSHCIQHEIDHLDGILFIDHLSALKKNMILRKLLKERKRTSSNT